MISRTRVFPLGIILKSVQTLKSGSEGSSCAVEATQFTKEVVFNNLRNHYPFFNPCRGILFSLAPINEVRGNAELQGAPQEVAGIHIYAQKIYKGCSQAA